jgi:two-component system sensor histidine kinase LytS
MLGVLIENLANRVGIILILAFFLSRAGYFRKLVSKKNLNIKDKIYMSVIFGVFGIIGTYTGIHIQGAIANSRVIGVFVGGLLGGPMVGILSGIIAGGHRFLLDIGGFTSFACALSTFMEGIFSGLLKKRFENSPYRIIFALISGFIAEVFQMVIILLIAKPYDAALELVKVIGIPMVLANGIGIAVFIAITDSVLKGIEKEAAFQAQLALRIANNTMYFRKGFNEQTAYETAKVIKEMTGVTAVAFTDTEKILAHVGDGEGHHLPGVSIMTNLTRQALHKEDYIVANTKRDIACDNPDCELKSAILVPIKQQEKIIGLLKLYKDKENAITQVDAELALGLAQLFSTQIELSNVDYQRELLAKSELKALQAQVNPHFLFNAINTIVSYTRTQPDNARRLLVHLGDFFRSNLQGEMEDVDLLKEIEHINSYVEIERARFGDKLQIVFDIEEGIDCKIPPLLLQPLVENAIKHGLMDKIEGGKVVITARNCVDCTEIKVEDNGIGMESGLIESILIGNGPKDCIGLKNINDRLKNKYGKNYGLDIDSRLSEGTSIRITIPRCMEALGA